MNCCDGSHAICRSEFTRTREGLPAYRLHTHLYHAVRTFQRTAHASRVVRIKSHGFFLVDILARLDGGNEIERVLVLGSSNQNGVDRFVVEQAAKIGKCPNRGNKLLGFLEAASVDVSNRYGLGIGRTERVLENVQSAPAGADQPEADPVIGAEDTRRQKN
jgi:hypothetical protein